MRIATRAAKLLAEGHTEGVNSILDKAFDAGESQDILTILYRYAAGYGVEKKA